MTEEQCYKLFQKILAGSISEDPVNSRQRLNKGGGLELLCVAKMIYWGISLKDIPDLCLCDIIGKDGKAVEVIQRISFKLPDNLRQLLEKYHVERRLGATREGPFFRNYKNVKIISRHLQRFGTSYGEIREAGMDIFFYKALKKFENDYFGRFEKYEKEAENETLRITALQFGITEGEVKAVIHGKIRPAGNKRKLDDQLIELEEKILEIDGDLGFGGLGTCDINHFLNDVDEESFDQTKNSVAPIPERNGEKVGLEAYLEDIIALYDEEPETVSEENDTMNDFVDVFGLDSGYESPVYDENDLELYSSDDIGDTD